MTEKIADILPLSFAQENILLYALTYPEGPDPYLVQAQFRVDPPVGRGALREAVAALLERHPNLRACFRHQRLDQPVQVIPRQAAVPWTEVSWPGCDEDELAARLSRLRAEDRSRRFDLARPPLVRATLVRHDAGAELLLTMHHVLVDGWSLPILARDLAALYAGGTLPPPVPYRQFLAWQRRQDLGPAAAAWRAALADLPRPQLPPPDPGHPSELTTFLPVEPSAALARRAAETGVTLNTLTQAAFALVLSRMTGADDVVFGGVVSGRPPELPGMEAMVGLLAIALPVRVRLRAGERVAALLARIQEEQLVLSGHQQVRLADLQCAAGMRDLYDAMLAFENFPQDNAALAGGVRLVATHDGSHLRLTLVAMPGERLLLRLLGRGDVDLQAVTARLERALAALAGDPEAPVSGIDVLSERERDRLLALGAGHRPAVPEPSAAAMSAAATIGVRFAAQAALTPQAPAVRDAGRTLTYAELSAAADRLAARLAAAGVGPETPVGLLLPRSTSLVVAQLAVVLAGGCYLPLDPTDPDDRLARLLMVSCTQLVVTDRDPPGWLPDTVRTLSLSSTEELAEAGAPGQIHPDSAAYVMFTSGSTGEPKGVVTTHRGVTGLAADHRFDDPAHRRVLFHSPHTFDAATYEVWVPLLRGGTVVVAPPEPVTPELLERILPAEDVTALWLTAELLRAITALAPEALSPLRTLWAGGDVLAAEAVRRIQQHCPDTALVNGYGPTETTVFATCHPVGRTVPTGAVPIGAPIDHARGYVLDSRLRPVPEGTTGELYLAGAGLARGYLGQPAGTAERFVANPYGPPGERMYRTGDLVRWTGDGCLEFAGRADDQVKVRGFRVEPGEVEATLEACPGVARAVVTAGPDPVGGKRLAAHLVLAGGVTMDAVRHRAAQILPSYLLPSTWTQIERVPLTPHGKVDRAALPDPVSTTTSLRAASVRERRLCELFAAVLGVPRAGPDDDFFVLGGHSLLALRLVAQIESELGVRVPLGTVFEAPTPATLAARLDRPDVPANRSLAPLITLRVGGDRTPLFCLHPGFGLGWSYTALLPHLPPDRPVHALQSPVLSGGTGLPGSIEAVAEEYLPRIRAVQPEGPYLLLGRSFGGPLAYQLAVLLRREGQQVGLLAVVDAMPVPAAYAAQPLDPDEVEQETLRILLRNLAPATGPAGRLARPEVFAIVRDASEVVADWSDAQLATAVDVCANHLRLTHAWRPPRYDGRVTLFAATAEPGGLPTADKVAAWRRTATTVDVHELACAHSDVLHPEPAAVIAAVVESSAADAEPDRVEYEFPVSPGQGRLLVADQLHPGSAEYHVPLAFSVSGRFDAAAFGRAVDALVARHEALRTVFRVSSSGGPIQVVVAEARADVRVAPTAAAGEVERRMQAEAARPFDLAHGPLLRCTIYPVTDGSHRILLSAHHLVCDGWSAQIMLRELAAAYPDDLDGVPYAPPELPIQYPDYAAWQANRLASGGYAAAVAHWAAQLRDAPETINLPTDHPRPAVRSANGSTVRVVLPPATRERLTAVAQANGTTGFVVLLAGYAAFLSRLCGQDDLVIGVPVAGRDRADLQDLVGMLTNTLAVRVDLSGDPTFHTLVDRVRVRLLAGAPYQDAPFDAVVHEVTGTREPSHDPLVQVMFSYDEDTELTLALPGAQVERVVLVPDAAKFDLLLQVERWDADLVAHLSFRTDLLDRGTVAGWAASFETLLAGLLADPEVRVDTVEMVGCPERRQILKAGDRARPPEPLTVHPDLPQPYVPADTATQRLVAGVWADVLGHDRLGLHDNFFELGGSSVGLLWVLAKLRETGDHGLELADLFRYPTIAALAAHIDRPAAAGSGADASARGSDRRELLAAAHRLRTRKGAT